MFFQKQRETNNTTLGQHSYHEIHKQTELTTQTTTETQNRETEIRKLINQRKRINNIGNKTRNS